MVKIPLSLNSKASLGCCDEKYLDFNVLIVTTGEGKCKAKCLSLGKNTVLFLEQESIKLFN